MSVADKSHNYMIDCLRMTFAIMMCIYHFYSYVNADLEKSILPCGYRLVDTFFVISGFFFASECAEGSYSSAVNCISKKYKKMYFQYIIAFIFSLPIYFGIRLQDIIDSTYSSTKQGLFLIQELMIIHDWGGCLHAKYQVNGVTWYISSMLLVFFIILLLKKIIKSNKLLIFLMIIIDIHSINRILALKGNLHVENRVDEIIPLGVMRGFIGISLGYILFHIVKHIEIPKKIKLMLFIIGIAWLIPLMYISKNTKTDCLILLSSLFIMSGSEEINIETFLDKKICIWFGRLSYPFYLNHLWIMFCLRHIGVQNIFAVIMLNLTLSLLLLIIEDRTRRRMNIRKLMQINSGTDIDSMHIQTEDTNAV